MGCEDAIEEAHNSVKTMAQPIDEDGSPRLTCDHIDCNEDGCKLLPALQGRIVINPKKLIGDGMSDPFDVYPTSGYPRHHSFLLNHCEISHLQALSLSVHPPTFAFFHSPFL